jgi:hypothetical protein
MMNDITWLNYLYQKSDRLWMSQLSNSQLFRVLHSTGHEDYLRIQTRPAAEKAVLEALDSGWISPEALECV